MVDPDARTHQPIVFVNLCVWLSVTVFLPLLALVRAILFCRLCIFFLCVFLSIELFGCPHIGLCLT